jgi:hypothetical protein
LYFSYFTTIPNESILPFFFVLLIPTLLLAQIQPLAKVGSDNRESSILFKPKEHTIDSLNSFKNLFGDLQKTGRFGSTI